MKCVFSMMDDAGRTLMVRATGGLQAPSLTEVALMGTVHRFAAAHGCLLHRFSSKDCGVFYLRDEESGFTLVMQTNHALLNTEAATRVLRLVREGIEQCLGPAALLEAHAAGLKQRLRGATGLVDAILGWDGLVPTVPCACAAYLQVEEDAGRRLSRALAGLCGSAGAAHAALSWHGAFIAVTRA